MGENEPRKGESGGGALPFPGSDMPPALQRTLARKMREERESGCGEGSDEMFREALRKAAQPKRSDP